MPFDVAPCTTPPPPTPPAAPPAPINQTAIRYKLGPHLLNARKRRKPMRDRRHHPLPPTHNLQTFFGTLCDTTYSNRLFSLSNATGFTLNLSGWTYNCQEPVLSTKKNRENRFDAFTIFRKPVLFIIIIF